MDKYLRQYAEPGTAAAADIPAGEPWQQVVVVPVCNENSEILRHLPPAPGRSLMILVVNEASSAPGHVSVANRDFVAELNARFRSCWQSDGDSGLSLFRDPASPRDVLLADRFSKGRKLPARGGVGHARKIGADLAAFLIHRQTVGSPWIHCTDADVCLPRRYFSCIGALNGDSGQYTAALVYPFRHCIAVDRDSQEMPVGHPQRLLKVTRLYEYSLRYYVAGLGFARSPYAFHTIGSTMAVNAAHYARVRGFPRRQAGEDFYLLNKLAKVGTIRQLEAESDCEAIEIKARYSDRVPFGTGAATGKIMALENPASEFLFYQPNIFRLLRIWLARTAIFWKLQSTDVAAVMSRPGPGDPGGKPSPASSGDVQALVDALGETGVAHALEHAFRQSKDAQQFSRQMHTWFDAFRTLKTIHYLRDRHLPSISFEALVTDHHLDHLMGYEDSLPRLHQEVCRDWL